jgi:hypothetical protein
VYNRVQHDAHQNGHGGLDESYISLQVRSSSAWKKSFFFEKLFNQKIPSRQNRPKKIAEKNLREKKLRVKINIFL